MPTHAQLMYQNNISLMKKSINAEKLIAEIEKRQEELSDHNFHSMAEEYDNILGIIASLQQKQPDKYETALEKARKWMPNVNQGGHAILIDIFPELGEGLDPRYGGRKQEPPKMNLEKEIDEKWDEFVSSEGEREDFTNIARNFYGLRNRALKEAALHVYESWMGGTMDDVRRDMAELGNVLNAKKEESK